MRCPGCNKFATLETQDPEVDLNVEISDDNTSAALTGTVRLVRTSECCGEEMKETTFEIDEQVGITDIDPKAEATGTVEDACQASGFDEMC